MAQFPQGDVRDHRTALFVDTTDASASFQERANRLIESLNGNQIKTDIFVVTNGGVTVERVANGSKIANVPASGSFSVVGAREYAREQGYTQVLVSLPV